MPTKDGVDTELSAFRSPLSALPVSVVIPALNEEAAIGRAAKSAWEAGAEEVIVADGGSADRTLAIAEEAGCRVLSSPAGRAVQQNRAASQARGAALLLLHADNWLGEGAIRQLRAALDNPHVLCGAFRQRIEAAGIAYRALERGNAARVRLLGLPYGDQAIFVRRETFEQLGGFPTVRLMEDLLIMKQLRRLAWPVLLPGPLHVSARRWQQNGVIRQTLRNWSLLVAHKFGASPDRLAQHYHSGKRKAESGREER